MEGGGPVMPGVPATCDGLVSTIAELSPTVHEFRSPVELRLAGPRCA